MFRMIVVSVSVPVSMSVSVSVVATMEMADIVFYGDIFS